MPDTTPGAEPVPILWGDLPTAPLMGASVQFHGLTKRELFAKDMMAALVRECFEPWELSPEDRARMARIAVKHADALIAALAEGPLTEGGAT